MKNYQNLKEAIYFRKSTRDYSSSVVEILENNENLIETFGLVPLVCDIKVQIKLLNESEVKNGKTNYCIGFYSENKPLALENIGFIGQQLDLELQSKGIGTCWWGMKKPKKEYKNVDGLECFITMVVGMPKKDKKREYPKGFSRKITEDMVLGDTKTDSFIESVRIAPSAVNRQPWLVEKSGDSYNFHLINSKNPLDKIIGDLRYIDMGIALAHLFVEAKANGLDPEFSFDGEDFEKHKFIANVLLKNS